MTTFNKKDFKKKVVIEHCSEKNCPECQKKLLNKFKKDLKAFISNWK